MKAQDQYHAGIVVDDLGAAKRELAELFGYAWGSEVAAAVMVTVPSGTSEVNLRLVYSVSKPRLELVETVPGTVGEPAAGSGVHHLGYWSDDIAADSAELEAHGYAHEASGIGPDNAPMWAYYRSATGPRIELVARALEPMMSALWTAPGM